MSEEGQIEKPQPDLVRKEPLPVPGDFEFVEMDMTNDTQVCIPHSELIFQVQEVYELLSGHYVEDEGSTFRFAYSASFFKWYSYVKSLRLRAGHY